MELALGGRSHSPTETELHGLVEGWDVALEHRAVAVTLVVQDFYVRGYLDGSFRVGRPWNSYWLDRLLLRLDHVEAPLWEVEAMRSRPLSETRGRGLRRERFIGDRANGPLEPEKVRKRACGEASLADEFLLGPTCIEQPLVRKL